MFILFVGMSVARRCFGFEEFYIYRGFCFFVRFGFGWGGRGYGSWVDGF